MLAAPLPKGSVLVGLTSIHWREAWKYGERAFRYCNPDVGHAIGAMAFAAAALGWEARLIETMPDAQLALLLGRGRGAQGHLLGQSGKGPGPPGNQRIPHARPRSLRSGFIRRGPQMT